MNLEELEKEVLALKERNRKVEEDKRWETSISRKILVALLTYIVVVLLLFIANVPHPYMGAVIPATAFFLSTLSLLWFKKLWQKFKKPSKQS